MFTKKLVIIKHLKPFNCTRIQNSSSFALKLVKVGNPLESVEKQDFGTKLLDSKLKDQEVLLQYLAAPINPADILYCRGLYGTPPKLPSFLGCEGVAKILKTGASVNNLKVNDWVITKDFNFGSWTTHAVKRQSVLVKVDSTIDLFAAAQLTVNPPTAYRLLKDFVELKPGMN